VQEILSELVRWQSEGATFALASVVATSQSAPRPAGAAMALHPDGTVIGSVSGGCVEGAVVELATRVLESGRPHRVTFGISDDEAIAVGLTCGGTIEVFIRPIDPESAPLARLVDAIATDTPAALVTIVGGPAATTPGGASPSTTQSLSGPSSDRAAPLGAMALATVEEVEGGLLAHADGAQLAAVATGMLALGQTQLRRVGPRGQPKRDELELFVEVFAPRPRMLVFGAIDFAAAVASMGAFLGFHVTVCDARERFATPMRFPDAHEIVVDWPHRYLATQVLDERAVICVLTHDVKFDVPVLQAALSTPAGYIGLMGSRRTQEDRRARLLEAGVSADSLARVRAPIGLDLGGRAPQETAVAIAAEIVMLRHVGTGRPLSTTDGPIHPGTA
jgi:xanthine dehydrogenase accessory factor